MGSCTQSLPTLPPLQVEIPDSCFGTIDNISTQLNHFNTLKGTQLSNLSTVSHMSQKGFIKIKLEAEDPHKPTAILNNSSRVVLIKNRDVQVQNTTFDVMEDELI